MRFLADMGVSRSTVEALRNLKHEAVHLRELGLQRLPDSEIMTLAGREDRVLLTFDLDFGALAAATGQETPSVITFRLANQAPAVVTPLLLRALPLYEKDLATGALLTIEETRYRLRRLPIGGKQPGGSK